MNNIIGTIEDSSMNVVVELKSSGPQGIPGETGKSIEYTWNGTQLGVRIEGETNYTYVNLKGDKGDPGEVDYTKLELKADKTYVDGLIGDINSALDMINGEVI